jgi:hypothetical protein
MGKNADRVDDIKNEPGAVTVLVTRHAVRRYAERARVETPAELAESELRDEVREAIVDGRLLSAGAGVHIVPFRSRRAWLCLILRVNPHPGVRRLIVFTVLTQTMAVRTFGHVIGLISSMSEPPHHRVAA